MVGSYIRDSEVINSAFSCTYLNLSTSETNSEIGKKGIGKSLRLVKKVRQVRKLLKNQKFDLCYLTLTTAGPGFYKDLVFVWLLQAFKQRIVYHFHNKGVSQAGKNYINDKLYRYVFADVKVIALSKLLYPDISRYISEDNVYYCANSVPKAESPSGITLEANPGKISILFLSNMTILKGAHILLEACSILNERDIPFVCHFVGDWAFIPEDEFQQKLNELHLSDKVFAHGKKYGRDKEQYLSSADIFVLPTLKECYPLVLLEAMQFGIPIIASREGAIPEIVKNHQNGILLTETSPREVAEKVQYLYENPEIRQAMGRCGKVMYEEKYTIERFEKRFTDILKKILAG